jgi:hypothetical protein
LTAPEATNAPIPVVVSAITTNTPATTNPPAPAIVPVMTNAPAATTPSLVTNPPPAAVAPAMTNQAPAAASAPVATNAPAAAAPAPAATPTAKPAFVPRPDKRVLYQPFNIGADAGTTGFGGTAGWRFADHFGLVGGVDFLNYSLDRTIENIPYTADLHFMSEYAALNLYPSRESSFHLSLGAYFNQNRFTGKAVSDGSLEIDGNPVDAGESVNLEYKQQPVVPYASIGGNVYFDRARHFSLGFEFGAFYLGNPKVKTTSTDPAITQDMLDSYSAKVAHDIKKVPVWPILKISLNYSF